MGKTLIAYYSRRGENYVNGSIVNLKLGNTEVVAGKIKALLPDADEGHAHLLVRGIAPGRKAPGQKRERARSHRGLEELAPVHQSSLTLRLQ